MSEEPDTPPFSTVDINNDSRDDEDLFASAVQEVSLDPEVNGTRENLDKISISDAPVTGSIGSPMMEEIATERANNIIITVTEPQKIGEGMSSYVAYRVLTKTNMPIFSKHDFSVLRRFSDFLGLYEKLMEKYLRSGRIIPPAPEKSIVGTTKVKMTSTPSTESANGGSAAANVQSQFVERRRASLERFLNRVAQHPVLCIDPDFREFLESDTELPKATSTSALSGAGMVRFFNKVGETVNKITYRMDESDAWFEERAGRIEALEACLRRLCGACEALAGERRELGARAHDAARAAAALSGADPHAPLSRALSHLADLHEKVRVFEERIEALEACLRRLCGACEALAGERRELGARAHDAARAAAALSGADPHAPLSRALSHLADLHEKVRVFEERIEALEACLRRLCGACEALAGERRELGARAHDAARAAAALSGADPHAPLSRALSHLADLHEKVRVFEERIEALEACLRRLCGACEALAGERRELGARAHDAARAAAALSGADPHAPLSRALSHLADLHEKVRVFEERIEALEACLRRLCGACEALAGERRELGARAHDAARAAAALSGADPHAPLSRALSHLADLHEKVRVFEERIEALEACLRRLCGACEALAGERRELGARAHDAARAAAALSGADPHAPLSRALSHLADLHEKVRVFEERIEALEACLRRLCGACEALAGERRELGARAHDAARAAAALSGADPHAPLSRALSHLADLHEKVRVFEERIEALEACLRRLCGACEALAGERRELGARAHDAARAAAALSGADPHAPLSRALSHLADLHEKVRVFEERIEALEACLRRLCGACEALAGERRELGARAHDAARAAAALSGADPHAPLSRALSHLADLHEKVRVFEERIEALEACLRRLCGACEALAGERRELGARAHDAARAAAALSGADPHAPLSRALSHLADLHEKIEQLRVEQSNTDFYVLTEHIKDYLGLIQAIKDVFHERVKVFQNWQHAQMQLTKRRENKAKAELANRPEKIEQASQEIIEWESKVERGQQEFDQISRVIKKELERWDEVRVLELRATLLRYLEEHMKHQAQAIRYWDAFLPEARAIK